MFLSLSAISCFSCLFRGFGFGFWVLFVVVGLGCFLVFVLFVFCFLFWIWGFYGGEGLFGLGFFEREAQLYSTTGLCEDGSNTFRVISI